MKVKLEDIIVAMEFAGMETEYYYDTQNGVKDIRLILLNKRKR